MCILLFDLRWIQGSMHIQGLNVVSITFFTEWISCTGPCCPKMISKNAFNFVFTFLDIIHLFFIWHRHAVEFFIDSILSNEYHSKRLQ